MKYDLITGEILKQLPIKAIVFGDGRDDYEP